MLFDLAGAAFELAKRADEETDPDEPDSSKKEIFASWALFISIVLLIIAFFTSYMLQQKKITAVHETVISIFAGMVMGLILRVGSTSVRNLVAFDYQIFFNLLLPPIILSSGYELHQANFFRNIGTILTFAFAGTFLSAMVIGVILWLYTQLHLEGFRMNWVEAVSVGATLSATDPVTILAIFNSYKVDPKLYTIIFGESILNDAIAIVIFDSAQKAGGGEGSPGILSVFGGIWIFLRDFFGSLLIGVFVGIMAALGLKYTFVRRYPKIESCLVVLTAYATYFFAQAIHMSGIVALLFCGITLKHYAYFNMSRRTQLTTKFFFQVLAQLSENFIFIYLGLSLFTDSQMQYQPLLILVTVLAVCAARYVAVFPLSKAINWVIRYRARRAGRDSTDDEIPYNHQGMLFWAGLRGAVGVALAALLTGEHAPALRATVLVVVVLTVIIFGGTTARMLEILGIRTGVVEEIDSDDEFDIETVSGGTFAKRSGTGLGYNPRAASTVALDRLEAGANGKKADIEEERGYASGHLPTPHVYRPSGVGRTASSRSGSGRDEVERSDLLGGNVTDSDIGSDIDISDLPPPAPRRRSSPMPPTQPEPTSSGADITASPGRGAAEHHSARGTVQTATAAIRQLFNTEDHAALFRQLDEDFIKPTLLLDGGSGGGRGGHGGHGNGGAGPS